MHIHACNLSGAANFGFLRIREQLSVLLHWLNDGCVLDRASTQTYFFQALTVKKTPE